MNIGPQALRPEKHFADLSPMTRRNTDFNTKMINKYVDKPVQVAVVAWEQMDLTDFTGPIEVLSHGRNEHGDRLLKTTIVATNERISTSQGVSLCRDVDVEEFLGHVNDFDVLVLPGGGGFSAAHIPTAPGVQEILNTWAALPARPGKPRILMSICAGAYFLANAGLLVSKTATTHYASLEGLKEVGQKHGDINVVRQHYVDAGEDANGLRIITSGGIVSGIDASFYLLEVYLGLEVAERSRSIMDASWRKEATPYGTR